MMCSIDEDFKNKFLFYICDDSLVCLFCKESALKPEKTWIRVVSLAAKLPTFIYSTVFNSKLVQIFTRFTAPVLISCNQCKLCPRLTRSWELIKLSYYSRLSALVQLLFSFDQDMRVDETLMQTLACQLSCNFFAFSYNVASLERRADRITQNNENY